MARSLAEFITGFVLPLMGGGPVTIGKPIRPRDFYALVSELGMLSSARFPDLSFLRLRRAQLLVAEPTLPDIATARWPGLPEVPVFHTIYTFFFLFLCCLRIKTKLRNPARHAGVKVRLLCEKEPGREHRRGVFPR